MATEFVELQLPMLEKPYKYTGEYRRVTEGDWFMHEGMVRKWCLQHHSEDFYPIVEREPWVPQPGETIFVLGEIGDITQVVYSERLLGLMLSGNYFKTKELAQSACDKMVELLRGCDHE